MPAPSRIPRPARAPRRSTRRRLSCSMTSSTRRRCSISRSSATSIRRITNPTQAVLEERIAALEGGTAALAVASGHAAQALVFHTLLEPGDEFVAARQLYGGSINQFTHSFKKFDWQVRWADTDRCRSPSARRSRRRPRRSSSSRSPIPAASSPTSRPSSEVAKEAGVPLIVDNTLATPYLIAPDRAWRRHHRAFADQVPRRARQLDRRRHRRLRHVRLARRAGAIRPCRRPRPPITASPSPRPSAISPSPLPPRAVACAISVRRSRRSTPSSF